jgi:hypothetical protein
MHSAGLQVLAPGAGRDVDEADGGHQQQVRQARGLLDTASGFSFFPWIAAIHQGHFYIIIYII